MSIKSECLDRMIILGEQHLRRAVRQYVEHSHLERHHQGLDGQLIEGERSELPSEGRVVRRERLGGLLSFFQRAAG